MRKSEIALLIERFLENRPSYPQEWNDFVDTPQNDEEGEIYRERCYELDPLVNTHIAPDEDAVLALRAIVDELKMA
jgi:hypothetical protein